MTDKLTEHKAEATADLQRLKGAGGVVADVLRRLLRREISILRFNEQGVWDGDPMGEESSGGGDVSVVVSGEISPIVPIETVQQTIDRNADPDVWAGELFVEPDDAA